MALPVIDFTPPWRGKLYHRRVSRVYQGGMVSLSMPKNPFETHIKIGAVDADPKAERKEVSAVSRLKEFSPDELQQIDAGILSGVGSRLDDPALETLTDETTQMLKEYLSAKPFSPERNKLKSTIEAVIEAARDRFEY